MIFFAAKQREINVVREMEMARDMEIIEGS
jgi:hypothetical protein